jgi:hypothetical protein
MDSLSAKWAKYFTVVATFFRNRKEQLVFQSDISDNIGHVPCM